MGRMRWGVAFLINFSLLMSSTEMSAIQFGNKLSLHGYLQNQTGMFIEQSRPGVRFDDDNTLSMLRNTLWLEGDYRPFGWGSIHTIWRTTLSGSLPSDRDAIITPEHPTINPRQRIDHEFYDEIKLRKMLREAYVDLDPTAFLSVRLGRQQVAWGETGSFRMLDVVNPVDNSWHFSSLESFEDIRKPLWMAKGTIRVPWLNGDLEGVLVPGIDSREDYTNTDPPLESAWYAHISPQDRGPTSAFSSRNLKQIHHRPGERFEDSRFGARWKGLYEDLTYSLVFFQNHMLSGVSERVDARNYVSRVAATFNVNSFQTNPAEVHFIYPKNTVVGGSLEYPLPYPLSTMARLEYVYEPHRTFSVSSTRQLQRDFLILGPCPAACIPREIELRPIRKSVHGAALVLERQVHIPFLNPYESFFVQAQVFERYVSSFRNEEGILQASTYEDARVQPWNTNITLALLGKYRHGTILPLTLLAIDPEGSGFSQIALGFAPGNHVRVTAGVNNFWGHHPFTSFGFFRDRDEIFLKTRFQF